VQIRIEPDGVWHRRRGNGTRCGEPIAGPFMSRDDVPEEDLCNACFTPRERLEVLIDKLQRANEEYANPALYYDPEDAPTDVHDDPFADTDVSDEG
jgi:hypothetical protein